MIQQARGDVLFYPSLSLLFSFSRMAGKRQPYTGTNSRRSSDALNPSVPSGDRFQIKPSLESTSAGAPSAATPGTGTFPFPSLSLPVFCPPAAPHLPPRSPHPRGREGQGVCPTPPTAAHLPRPGPASGPHLAAHLGGRGPSPRAHLAAAGGGPTPGREERRSAQPRRRPGRAEPARRGGEREAARWGGRPAAWPRCGCCCCWRWGTPGLTGRSRRTATGG